MPKHLIPNLLSVVLSMMILSACGHRDSLQYGLVAWFSFDRTLEDHSGFGQHASNVAPVTRYVPDRRGVAGSAINLDGWNDLLIAPISPMARPTGAVSVSVFYRTSSLNIQNLLCRRKKYDCYQPADYGGLGWSVNGYSHGEPHFAVIAPDELSCETPRGINGYSDVVYGMQVIDTGRWYHLACVFEKGIQRLYVNGRLSQSLSRPFLQLRECDSSNYVIGGYVSSLPSLFKGDMDELRIYNRALSEAEIQALSKDLREP